ncbi:TIGR03546 family protein [bacterium]|nr:TIGR03546 family protein [bacterium]MBU3955535.1 TIGR03546 family protein [bacterium]MBU4134355.1 TIGR03546 family protein [bacterium]
MPLIKYFFKFLKALNSNAAPGEVARGMAFGMILGLIPVSALHWWVILILMYLTNSNLAAGAVFTVLFKIIGAALGPVFDSAGYAVLTSPGLENFFTGLYNMPVMPFTRYYNTVVISTTIISFALFIPAVLIFRAAVKSYRTGVRDKIAETKFFKAFLKVPLVGKLLKLYNKINSVREAA